MAKKTKRREWTKDDIRELKTLEAAMLVDERNPVMLPPGCAKLDSACHCKAAGPA